ncbi:FkbM family methyltransferase [Tepidibacter sp. Z1-5]|uniref:FkbM family methyltransferase n=1 Tax=Tepidibacter sp. Z1-5 TaxID=3134138 RepID=UPI0030BC7C01
MDIEGAKLNALIGAKETLEKFKPKLTILVYHYINDFIDIFNYLESLNLGYKFYLYHYGIHREETILYDCMD